MENSVEELSKIKKTSSFLINVFKFKTNLQLLYVKLKFFQHFNMLKINILQTLLRIKSLIVNNKAIIFFLHVEFIWIHRLIYILIPLFFISCETISQNNEKAFARVGSVYIYREDIERNILNFKDKEDSILKVRNFIDDWASKQIILQQAALNLDENKIKMLEKLVKQYKTELFSTTYKQSIVNKSLDTLISIQEIDSFMFSNKSLFKLNAPLYQVRYIELPHDNVDKNIIQRSFQRFNKEDQYFLDSLSFQFSHHIFSDSIWLNKISLLSKIKFLNATNIERYIKKSQFFKIQDTMGVYLFYINNYLKKGDIPPRDFIYPTIKNIILNKRKLKFNKKFEKDILQDAIKSKYYEVY